jgi:hypothetical protein
MSAVDSIGSARQGRGVRLVRVATMVCLGTVGAASVAARAEAGLQTASSTSQEAYDAAEKTTQGNLGHPYVLPQASRARMHECGDEWQAMKMSGAATDKIWRVFAAACLASPSAKSSSASDLPKQR